MLKYKKLYLDSPELMTLAVGDAGYDLCAYGNYDIFPGTPEIINTGIAVEIPTGYVGFILPRSGLRFEYKLNTFGTGVIDSSYRGELKIILCLTPMLGDPIILNETPYQIESGDKVAQLVIVQYFAESVEEVSELSITARGSNGFGSTGR